MWYSIIERVGIFMDDLNRYFKSVIEGFDLAEEKRRVMNRLDDKFH